MENFLEELGLHENEERIKGIIESILFMSGDPRSLRELSNITEVSLDKIKSIIEEMKREYEKESRGIRIIEFNNKIQLGTKLEYGDYIKKLSKVDSRQNLSQAALETLSIIAYKQPITKAEIDELRGVRSERAIATLIERGLVVEGGRLDTVGKPILYVTTDDFLKYFGFKNIKELPELIEFNVEFGEE